MNSTGNSTRYSTTRIFLDANIPTYAGGTVHPLKQPCVDILQLAAQAPRRVTTDTEVFQELLHRYLALNRWALGAHVFSNFATVVAGQVETIEFADVLLAAQLVTRYRGLSARDLMHVAVMQRVGIRLIATADAGFEQVNGINRLDPAQLGEWRYLLEP